MKLNVFTSKLSSFFSQSSCSGWLWLLWSEQPSCNTRNR